MNIAPTRIPARIFRHSMPGFGCAIFTLLFLSSAVLGTADASPEKLNILWISCEDTSPDLGCYGDRYATTPNLDRFAAEGCRFDRAYVTFPVCAPSRSSIITGVHPGTLGTHQMRTGMKNYEAVPPPEVKCFTEYLRAAGYYCSNHSKTDYQFDPPFIAWDARKGDWRNPDRQSGQPFFCVINLGCSHESPCWDITKLPYEPRFNPRHLGFDEFVGFLHGGGGYHSPNFWRDGLQPLSLQGYSTDIITDRSLDFIRRHQDKPFFLYVAHQAVHNPYQTRDDTPDKREPGWNQNAVNDVNRLRYKKIVEDLDQSVGRILDTVSELGLAQDTLVFFWSDNGDVRMCPDELRPYRGGKFSHFEGGHRVPAVAWWPGKITAGTKSDALLAGFDLFPTLTDLAGISKDNPANLDGSSAKDHFLQQKPMADRDLFFGYEPKLGTAMRRGHWKMIIKGDDLQLYNLKNDLKETTNVAAPNPEITDPMRRAIEQFKQTVTPGS